MAALDSMLDALETEIREIGRESDVGESVVKIYAALLTLRDIVQVLAKRSIPRE